MTVVCPRWNKTDLKTTDRLLLPVLPSHVTTFPSPSSLTHLESDTQRFLELLSGSPGQDRKDAQNFFIGASTAKELDEGNFGAQTASHATHLQFNNTTTNNDYFSYVLEKEHTN